MNHLRRINTISHLEKLINLNMNKFRIMIKWEVLYQAVKNSVTVAKILTNLAR